jgi:hypothetical protein
MHFMKDDKRSNTERPENYPRPSESDNQFKQQEEFVQKQSNKMNEQANDNDSKQDAEQMKRGGNQDTIGNP